jgi:uncharacterized protein (TIGR03084 family)
MGNAGLIHSYRAEVKERVVEEIVAVLARQHAELAGMLAGLDESDWARDSRCEGWTVSDVVLHLAQTDEMALASAEGRYAEALAEFAAGLPAGNVDDAAGAMVARERQQPASAVRDRWEAGASALRDALAACEPSRRVEWLAGELSARTLATTRVAETWIHTGDVADALGVTLEPDDRLWHIARLAWRTLPYAFERAGRELSGTVAFALQAPGGETWEFVPERAPATMLRGDAVDLCLVAARRLEPKETGLQAEGPDAAAVLELVRTYA